MNKCRVYVDGTFYNKMYGGGYVVYEGNHIIWQDCGVGHNDKELLAMRNIAGEMTAAMHAAFFLYKNNKQAKLYHDYTGLAHWVTGEWNANNKYTQMYRDFMRPYYEQGIITFKWVKGHTKVEGNEIADRLARQSVIYRQSWKL